MKVISLKGTCKLHLKRSCAAIGIFDGVHRGHQYLIAQMLAEARRLKAQPIVITFFPHPAHVLRPDVKIPYISALEDRFDLLDQLGVSACLVVRFNRAFARIEPEKFIKDILVKQLGVKAIFVGKDFRFGKDRSGDVALFQRLVDRYGYAMHAVAPLKQGRVVISSTRIRGLVQDGKMDQAAQLLGRPMSVSGVVVQGAQRGRSLGYPTANVAYTAELLPAKGVYVVRVVLGGKKYPAVANIGVRPSFKTQDPTLHLEVHIFDFAKNIYGCQVQVEFLKKIRNEKKFASPQHLIRQIHKDAAFARRYQESASLKTPS